MQSLTVLCWSIHSEDGPTLDFLRQKDLYGARRDGEDVTDEEKVWNAFLDELGFKTMDEFDLVLLEGIQSGFFDEATLVDRAGILELQFNAYDFENLFRVAYRLYHDSFDDNETEVVEEIVAAFHKYVKFVSPLNLNATVKLLKDLGHNEKAAEAIEFYMKLRSDNLEFFNLSNYPFGDDVTDPDVRAAFNAKYESFKDDRSPAEILMHIGRNDNFSRDDLVLLSKLSANDFYAIFKKQKGTDLSRIIRASTQFENAAAVDEAMTKGISAKAKEALVRIGKESPINRRRVKKHNIQISD